MDARALRTRTPQGCALAAHGGSCLAGGSVVARMDIAFSRRLWCGPGGGRTFFACHLKNSCHGCGKAETAWHALSEGYPFVGFLFQSSTRSATHLPRIATASPHPPANFPIPCSAPSFSRSLPSPLLCTIRLCMCLLGGGTVVGPCHKHSTNSSKRESQRRN